MPLMTRELSIPQPDGDPIVLNNEYGAASQYQSALKELGGKRDPEVAPYLLASIVRSANSMDVPGADIVEAARDLQAADDIVRTVPGTPVIYRLHCEYAVGLTPDEGTAGFRVVDTAKDRIGGPFFQTVIPTGKQFRVQRGPNYEHDAKFSEGNNLAMYQPLSFLVSGEHEAFERFHSPKQWRQYPNSHVVVGHEAVASFLSAQAGEDLTRVVLDEEDQTPKSVEMNVAGVVTSWALLASSALRRMGYDHQLNQAGDFVHKAGIEGLADVVATAMGYNEGITRDARGNDDMILRRLGGITFDPEQDAPVVGEKAAERALSSSGRARRFDGLLYGDEPQLKAHLTEVAGNFMAYLAQAA